MSRTRRPRWPASAAQNIPAAPAPMMIASNELGFGMDDALCGSAQCPQAGVTRLLMRLSAMGVRRRMPERSQDNRPKGQKKLAHLNALRAFEAVVRHMSF